MWLRVLVVGLNYAPEPTGIAPYTAGLCRGLAARGHAVRAVTTMPHYPEWRIRPGYEGRSRRENIDGVRVQRLRHYVPSQPSGVRRLLSEVTFGLHSLLTSWGRPDVAVFVSPALFATAIGMVRARLLGIPAVVWVQDIYSLGVVETTGSDGEGFVARTITRIESMVVASAAGVCVIHDRFADVARRMGAHADAIEVIRNWTHLSTPALPPRADARAQLGWGEGVWVALHAGAMGRKQDLDNVLAAARLAQEGAHPVHFVLMGHGGERARLETAAKGLRTLTFIDPLPDRQYQAALAAADVLIVNEHAGLREMAVPSKLTSYFSSGRPVIAATDRDSVTAGEIKASQGGIQVQPGDPAAFLNGILSLRADPQHGDELGRNGQAYRDSVLSESAAIDHFEAWIKLITHRAGYHVALRPRGNR